MSIGLPVRGSVFRIAVEQFDRHPFRPAEETYAHTGAHGGRLASEFNALLFKIGRNCIDPAHRQAEMVEPAIGRDRRHVYAVAGSDWGDEDIGAAEFEIDARLTFLHGADHLRAKHGFEPLRHALRIGGAQMNMVPSDPICDCVGHGTSSHNGFVRRPLWPNRPGGTITLKLIGFSLRDQFRPISSGHGTTVDCAPNFRASCSLGVSGAPTQITRPAPISCAAAIARMPIGPAKAPSRS